MGLTVMMDGDDIDGNEAPVFCVVMLNRNTRALAMSFGGGITREEAELIRRNFETLFAISSRTIPREQ